MSTYSYAVKVRKAGRYVWRWDCPACEQWESSSSVRKARSRVYRWAVLHAATCEDLHWANWTAACNWHGYRTIKQALQEALAREIDHKVFHN